MIIVASCSILQLPLQGLATASAVHLDCQGNAFRVDLPQLDCVVLTTEAGKTQKGQSSASFQHGLA